MSHSLSRFAMGTTGKAAFLVAGMVIGTASPSSATVIVPYSGSFNEATVAAEGGLPAGDFDTIGGGMDVGQFNLVAGTNTFTGSVYTPGDSSDFILLFVGANQTLTGASIAFGTNLNPGLTLFAAPAPQWTLQDASGITPTAFDLTVGFKGQSATQFVTAPDFSRGTGFYDMLIGNGTYAAYDGTSQPVAYTMTFTVDQAVVSPVPLPAALPLLVGGLAAFGVFAGRKRRKA